MFFIYHPTPARVMREVRGAFLCTAVSIVPNINKHTPGIKPQRPAELLIWGIQAENTTPLTCNTLSVVKLRRGSLLVE